MNKLVVDFLDKGYLLSPDIVDRLNELGEPDSLNLFNKKTEIESPLILDKNLFMLLVEEEDSKIENVKEFIKNQKTVGEDLAKDDIEFVESEAVNGVIVLKEYKKAPKKRAVQDFVEHYRSRYNSLKNILLNRVELRDPISISRILNKKERENVSLIGLVFDKSYTKNNNLMLTIEDITGSIKVLVNKGKESYNLCKDIVLDEVIGVKGVVGNKIIFLNSVFFPNTPSNKTIKRSNEDVNVAFISDIHIGSVNFLKENFLKFISWLNGELGDLEQKEFAKKIKYLFVIGDAVDGVGVYPGQEEFLEIKDVVEQYSELAKLLDMIRKDVTIIICGGQHDTLRLDEPQPKLDMIYAGELFRLPNIISVSNPSLVNIGKNESFEGFDILMYHGASFHHYKDNVESLRKVNATNNPSFILQYLLQKRHLAPTHGSVSFIPDAKEDFLVIEKVPDVLVSGEMHRPDVSNFNNILTINCSCWQSKTPFEEKIGSNPDPCKVPVLNLKNREIKIMNFS